MNINYEIVIHGGNRRSKNLHSGKGYNHKAFGYHPDYGGYKDLENVQEFFEIEKVYGIFQENDGSRNIYRMFFKGVEK